RYVVGLVPWEVRSAAALLYLPEQVLWYVLMALMPFGLVGAFRRDVPVASVLFGYGLMAAVTVALTGGNIGTLVRHRGLALPFIPGLSAVGACDLVRWAWGRLHAFDADRGRGPLEVQPTWL